jgi:hypothetical protein
MADESALNPRNALKKEGIEDVVYSLLKGDVFFVAHLGILRGRGSIHCEPLMAQRLDGKRPKPFTPVRSDLDT